MTLILSGTDGLSDVDGSAATPAIRGTDANTGIFFPAADTIAFSEGGTEAMRLDSAGNMGLGVTPSAWSASYKAISIGLAGGGQFASGTANTQTLLSTNLVFTGTGATGWKLPNNVAGTNYEQYLGIHKWYNAPANGVNGDATLTQAMTLDASGRLGITETSPAYKVDVKVSTAGSIVDLLRLNNAGGSNGGGAGLVFEDAGARAKVAGVVFGANENSGLGLGFYTSTDAGGSVTERGRIDSSGQFLIGTITSSSNYGLRISGNRGIELVGWGNARGEAMNLTAHNTSNADVIYFNTSAAQVGKISITSSATSYVTSSDYRLKENIAPMTGALATVSALKPCTYTWKSDGSDGQGFIAHELQEVYPDAVTGEKDAVNEDGSINPQGIDTSFLVATLTAAIQELKAIVDAQAVEIAALKGTA